MYIVVKERERYIDSKEKKRREKRSVCRMKIEQKVIVNWQGSRISQLFISGTLLIM